MKRASSVEVLATATPGDVKTSGGPDGVPPPKGSLSLWLWVGAGFLLLLVGWGVLFTVARQTNVQSVPLALKEARP